jgi:ketosteroid isomerase-like protein
MSQHDALIQDIAAAFNECDFARLRAWLRDDAVFDWSRAKADNRGIHQGLGAIEVTFERFMDPWERLDWEAREAREVAPGRLLLSTRVVARGRDSGVEVSATGAQVWELRDGKVGRVTLFQSLDDAEAALADGLV